MTSKERVMMTLEHKEPDRVPLDIGGINNTAMHFDIENKIKEKFQLEDHGNLIKSRQQNVVVPDQSIVDYFGVDTCSIYFNEVAPWKDNGDGTFTDMWGVGQKLNPDGLYYNMCFHPLEDKEDLKDLENFRFPEPTEYMVKGLRERIEQNKDKCCILEGFREPMFGLPTWLRGNQNYYMDLLDNEEFSDRLHEIILDYYIKLVDFLMERIGDGIDIVKFADDMGTQTSLIMSPEVYRERIKPWQAKLYDHVKRKYGKKILLHSCGAISPIIGDLIEIGVDALNPVQITAKGMAPEELKKRFGNNITFWGGGVDTQRTLNMGTPAQVREQVEQNMKIFKEGGGYVFAQVHNIMYDVPLENVLSMYETYRKFAEY